MQNHRNGKASRKVYAENFWLHLQAITLIERYRSMHVVSCKLPFGGISKISWLHQTYACSCWALHVNEQGPFEMIQV
jgi:hypothetical protein